MRAIQLTKGRVALVDDDDYAAVMRHSWYAHNTGDKWYAATRIRGTFRYLHRFLMDAAPGQEIDHVNSDGLDCRRENLRPATRQQQSANSRLQWRSRFKGVKRIVHRDGSTVWRAVVSVHRVRRWRVAASEIDAARLYNEMAAEAFGPFAKPNDFSAQTEPPGVVMAEPVLCQAPGCSSEGIRRRGRFYCAPHWALPGYARYRIRRRAEITAEQQATVVRELLDVVGRR